MRKNILLLILLSSTMFANSNNTKGKDCMNFASLVMEQIENEVGCFDDPECYNELWQIFYDHCRDSTLF